MIKKTINKEDLIIDLRQHKVGGWIKMYYFYKHHRKYLWIKGEEFDIKN